MASLNQNFKKTVSEQPPTILVHPVTSSNIKKQTLEAALLAAGVPHTPTPPPDTLRPAVHEVFETIGQHAELKGADAAALLRESSPVVAIAYELARRGWLTIDHAHQIYLGLNFGKSAMDEELHRLILQPQDNPSEKLSEQEARSIIEALLPAELQSLWAAVFCDARVAKYTEDTGSYLYLRPKNAPLVNQPISGFTLQIISLEHSEALPDQGRGTVIVAKVGDEYHARIFDKSGQILFGMKDSLLIPDQVHELDAMISARLTNKPSGSRFPPSDAEILDGVAASIVLRPITFGDLFKAAENDNDDTPLKQLTRSVVRVARFNARAQVPDRRLSDPDPAEGLTAEKLATDAPFPGTHSGPILSGLSLRQALNGLEALASRLSHSEGLGECELVWVSKSEGTLTLGASSNGGDLESIRASSTSRHVLSPSLAASRIDPNRDVLQQVDCLFPQDGEPLLSWNDLISKRVSPVCSMQKSLVRTLSQAPLGRLEQELPILRDNIKVLIITPSLLSEKKNAALGKVARSLRKGTGAHEVEFLTYEEALDHHFRVPSRENPSPQNKVRGAGLVVLLDPAYGKAGDVTLAQTDRNLFFRLALSQQINSAPPTAYPFDTLQQTLIIGSRGQGTSDEPNASATSVLWHLLSSVFDVGMMKNPPTIKFLDETVSRAVCRENGNWQAKLTYPDGLPRLSIVAEGVRHFIKTTDARPQGVSGHYQFSTCAISNPPSSNASSESQQSLQGSISVIPLAGLGSATEIVPDSELQRTKDYWKAVLAGMRGTEEYQFPLSRETFIQFFNRAGFPITELEGVRFEAIREGDGYRIANRRFSQEQFTVTIDELADYGENRADRFVRQLLEKDEVALCDEGSHLCNIFVNSYPSGIPSPRDGAGAKPDGRFNENTMSLFGKRIVPFCSPSGTLCFMHPMGVTTEPLARVEGIGEKATAHGLLCFSNNIDSRTAAILGSDSPGGTPFLIDAQPGGVGTAQEIFSAKGNILIVEKDPGDPLAKLFCAERERQGLPYTLIPADESVESFVGVALSEARGRTFRKVPWDELMRNFPVWDTGISEELHNEPV